MPDVEILVIGASGLTGAALMQAAGPRAVGCGSRDADVRDQAQLAAVMARYAPRWVILTAAMSNVDACERTPELAHATRNDVIMATGRSDYPNQVNNVLGFPFIFRGALDVRAKRINEEMKVAAANALRELDALAADRCRGLAGVASSAFCAGGPPRAPGRALRLRSPSRR